VSKNKLKISDIGKIPNIISLFRLIISLFILSSLLYSIEIIWIQIIYIIGAFSDKADGIIARKFNWETKLGQYLEGIADGALIFTTIIFLTFRLDFPLIYIIISFTIFVLGFIFILAARAFTDKWFPVILPENRLAVFLGHIVIILYIFSVPMREKITAVIFLAGIIIFLIYLTKIIKFLLKNINIRI